MKVLMTADAVGGVWSYALQLVRALEPLDVSVDLAVMGPPPSAAQRAQLAVAGNVRLHVEPYRLEWMRDPWRDVERAGEWLQRLERDARPDIVHLNGYAHARMAWRVPVLVAAHSCVLTWWRAVHGTDAPPEWDRYRTTVADGLRAADAIVAPTRALLHAMRDAYGFDTNGVVIPNGCAIEGTAALWPRAPRSPLILAAGRLWDEAKNMQTLAAAARRMPWPVHVAGSITDPSGEPRTLRGLHALGLLPPDALRRWYRRASIFVHPALYEPFGMAPLEAALHGCALVLSDLPGLREVWDDAAVFVPPRDDISLAETLGALAREPARTTALARAAHSHALRYSAATMARAYHELYRDTIRRKTEAMACAS